jgi:hypothetical protein
MTQASLTAATRTHLIVNCKVHQTHFNLLEASVARGSLGKIVCIEEFSASDKFTISASGRPSAAYEIRDS